MRSIAAVVFDFDGTLVDESRSFEEALAAACRDVGLKPPNRMKVKTLARQHPDIYLKHLIPSEVASREDLAKRFMEAFTKAYDSDGHKHAKLTKHAKPLLRALKACGVKVGLVSRRTTLWYAIPEILALFSISHLVDRVVTCREAETKKEQLTLCLRRLDVEPSVSSMVGDTAEDILAGKAVGCITIAYSKGFGELSDLLAAEPDYLIADLIDVLRIVASKSKA
ncbi:MAG: HAD family hydrolase [Thaumarchaeota archaeon]|nr:HAD family hydrolase [Nitrososphaerota archaeon]